MGQSIRERRGSKTCTEEIVAQEIRKEIQYKQFISIPVGQRLGVIYTILGDTKEIVYVILDVLDHKEYYKLFGYAKN